MYNKLFAQILDSSIWLEEAPTRLVWITLLAAMDEDGFARFAAVGNLAHRAHVSVDDARKAVDVLESPDPDSSDPENEGRRIQRVPGGWMVLNRHKYADLASRAEAREQTRIRVQRFRAKHKECNAAVTPGNVTGTRGNEKETPSDTDTDTESESEKNKKNASAQPGAIKSLYEFWKAITQNPSAKLTPKRKEAVRARLREGYTIDDLREAVKGCRLSPYHNGRNPEGAIYDDLELICRSGEKVEQFKKVWSQRGSKQREEKSAVLAPETPRLTVDEYIAIANKHEEENQPKETHGKNR